MRGPYRKRRVDIPPRFKQFKPAGVPSRAIESITLTIDEYEGLRLADYLGMDHQQSADKMNISRPTFSRLIEKARNKVATAIIEGKALLIEGGNIDFAIKFYQCARCGFILELPRDQVVSRCPQCGSAELPVSDEPFPRGRGHGRRGR